MPVRWPVWIQAAINGVIWSTLMSFTWPMDTGRPWPARIGAWATLAVLFAVIVSIGLAVSQRRTFGDRLTGAQRAQAEAIMQGRATSDDPRLLRAAFSLAREWTSWQSNPAYLALAQGLFLLITVAVALAWRPQVWLFTAILAVASPWSIWRAARDRAAATRFLATASPPAEAVAGLPWDSDQVVPGGPASG